MSSPTPLYTAIEDALGQPLAEYVAEQRENGLSYRRIALAITARTSIDVTGEALRIWTKGRRPVSQAGAA